ncbi:MAG: hypothetical protein WA136_04135 [Rhodoferax sp.]
MADTVITCTVSPCTVVIQLDSPILSMSLEDGTLIGFAIVAVWLIGFVYREISRAIKDDGISSTGET